MRFHMHEEFICDSRVKLRNIDRTPTTFSYGTCEVETDLDLAELDAIGLTPVEPGDAEREADRRTLMRMEAPHIFNWRTA